MQKVKLKAIEFDVDFRKNEVTNYNAFAKSKKFPGELKPNEAFLFISKSGNQLMWVLNVIEFDNERGRTIEIFDTRRWRILRSTWDPYMLQNYANEVGIHLVGFRRFEEVYSKR